jgi:hypothetical protein
VKCVESAADVPLTRVLALHSNSVCRGSIVSRARRALTAFGVSASVLAAKASATILLPFYGLACVSARDVENILCTTPVPLVTGVKVPMDSLGLKKQKRRSHGK